MEIGLFCIVIFDIVNHLQNRISMKRTISIIILLMSFLSNLWSQGYDTLWKKVNNAERDDQPRTQISILTQIQERAAQENAYGHLLASTLRRASLEYDISPDSLSKWVTDLEEKESQATNVVLQSIYDVVLSQIYDAHPALDDHKAKASAYRAKALSHPDALAAERVDPYIPFLKKGVDSQIFGNDLLHVVALETNQREWLLDWYRTHGNREASCLLATDLAGNDLQALDRIIAEYQDLLVCGHAAIVRFHAMPQTTNDERKACYDFAFKALRRWSEWKEIGALRNSLEYLIRPRFTADLSDQLFHPYQSVKIVFNDVCNLSELHVRVLPVRLTNDHQSFVLFQRSVDGHLYKNIQSYIDKGSAQTFSVSFHGHPVYEQHTDSLLLPHLSPGLYLLEFYSDNKSMKVERRLIAVSNLRLLWQTQPEGKIRLAVVRADNGQPVAAASVHYYQPENDHSKSKVVTDKNGEAIISIDNNEPYLNTELEFWVQTPQDKALPANTEWANFTYNMQEGPEQNVRIFTDRAIYRPGQTVYVNLMAWTMMGTETKATADRPVTLTLRDANGRDVAEKSLTTDAFGTAATEFHLPSTGLTGHFTIVSSLGYEREAIRVEEYKRPTFEVIFDPYQDRYAPGDTIVIKGTARTYSGVGIDGAKVSYTVVRRPSMWWRWFERDFSEATILEAQATTDADGLFEVRLPLTIPEGATGFYRFDLQADVTDLAGESHRGTLSIPLGNKDALLSTDLPEKLLVDTDNKTFTLQYRNAAGKEVEASVRYGFFATNDGLSKAERMAQLTHSASTNTPIQLPRMKSGAWTLLAVCGNDTLQHPFVLFSLDDKRPVVTTHNWFYQTSEIFPRDGKPVCIQVGSSDADQHILYSVISGNRVLENGRIDQSDALTLMKFKYKKEYGDGLRLCFAWVHDGVAYTHTTTIARPLPEKQISLSWRTFRDRLTPGQQETWTLEARNPDGTPANAQLMATLYDKSLDQLSLHRWDDNVAMNLYLPTADWTSIYYGRTQVTSTLYPSQPVFKTLSFSELDKNYFSSLLRDYDGRFLYGRSRHRMCMYAAPGSASVRMMSKQMLVADMEATLEEPPLGSAAPSGANEAGSATETDSNAPVQLRENLEDTAFFYPQLRTDSLGQVSLQFRLPESVTTWRFMGLAHDKEMRHGLIEADVVAQKDVMVQPNLPRFLRLGDHAVIATRISNTSDVTRKGVVRLQFLLPADESVVYEEEQPFSSDPHQTVRAAFSIAPSLLEGQEGLLIVRIIAQGDGFSDGEQHYLPVLTDKQYVTTTLPFTQHEPGTLQLDLKQLFKGKGIERPSLTIEYTNNPAWILVQALPYVGDINEKNAISLSAALFANTLARTIVKENPTLKTVFKQWEQESGTETSLQSQLEKNEALKALVLTETPWVVDAQSESAQRRAIAAYFNDNQISHALTNTISSLRKLQNADGSFSWWQGMDGSFYMTVAVTKTLVRLQVMTGEDATLNALVTKAFRFLDKEVARQVTELKKRKDFYPSDALCDYLYTNALAQRTRTADTDYLLRLMTRRASELTIYGKANTAVILALYDQHSKALAYLKSLKEYTVYREEMGRYFDTPRASYSWFNYRIPSQVAAIEAIRTLTPDDTQTLSEMRRWLLQAKRTQAWDTPFNAVEVIWAFADKGHLAALTDSAAPTRLSIDGRSIEEQGSAGLGYVRHTETMTNAPATLTAEKSSDGTSWGAVYAQYLQPMREIRASSAGLKVSRELLDEDGKPATQLTVGDRVRVRITIQADRDYDFVMVNDMRAACLEPVVQESGYQWGYYLETRDQSTRYFFHQIAKGKHVVETEYYIDREGNYLSGTCTAQCAYAPEYSGRTTAVTVKVLKPTTY